MKTVVYAFIFATMICGFSSCDKDDDKLDIGDPVDYNVQTFSADLKYVAGTPHGEIAYTQQTFMQLGKEEAVHIGNYGEDTWVNYNLYTESEDYNVSTTITDWDIALTTYVDPIDMGGEIYPYSVTGALINTEEELEVALYEYTESDDILQISEAYNALTMDMVNDVEYSKDIDAIAYGWKSVDMSTGIYTVATNQFFIIKKENGDMFKLRFISFHGTESNDDRIIKLEYALMQ